MKVVATGAFTILHPGHLLFLKEAKKLGDKLVVIVARDKMVKERKEASVIPEEQRLEMVKNIKFVDDAILGDEEDMFKPIQEINPDVIALGRDQDFDEEKLQKELQKRNLKGKVVRIEKYWDEELNSTQKIVERIKEL